MAHLAHIYLPAFGADDTVTWLEASLPEPAPDMRTARERAHDAVKARLLDYRRRIKLAILALQGEPLERIWEDE